MRIDSCNNEYELLLSIANGSEEAFARLFNQYKNDVYAHALHFTQSILIAEEITQDVFLKLWLKRDSLSDIEVLQAWLFTLARNLCFNHLKKMAREHRFKNEITNVPTQVNDNVESYISVKEQQTLLQQAVDRLSPKQKMIFVLNREGGMKNAEIAEQLNLSPNTVKTHMVSAIRSIRLFFKAHADQTILLILLVRLFVK